MSKETKDLKITCVLCGDVTDGMHHNPDPVSVAPGGRCCDTCNTTKVIPARIKRMKENLPLRKNPCFVLFCSNHKSEGVDDG